MTEIYAVSFAEWMVNIMARTARVAKSAFCKSRMLLAERLNFLVVDLSRGELVGAMGQAWLG